MIACPCPKAPNAYTLTYTLALPHRMRGSPTVTVDGPGPVSDTGQEGEHEVELLLNRRRTVRAALRGSPLPPRPRRSWWHWRKSAEFRLAAPAEVLTGAALIRQAVLYHWSAEGWVRGSKARRTRAAWFTHMMRYGRTPALGSAETPAGRWAPQACPLAWLPFSRTAVKGLPARGRPGLGADSS